MTARILHEAHTAAAKMGHAWSDSPDQAMVRSAQIVTMLARLGMLRDVGEIGAEFVYKLDE